MKIIFMGTPDFASGALEAIVKAGHEVAAVVTQPDKPKGRGKEMQMMPAKIWVCEHPCVPSSQIPWGCAYPVGNFEWGKGNRDNDYADGQRPGYRRHIDDAGSSHRGKGNRGVLIR